MLLEKLYSFRYCTLLTIHFHLDTYYSLYFRFTNGYLAILWADLQKSFYTDLEAQ